jgi:hypothetical protein
VSFSDELDARITDLKIAAHEAYRRKLAAFGFVPDGRGGVVVDESITPSGLGNTVHPADIEAEGDAYRTFLGDLESLADRFKSYDYLDPSVELTQRVGWLGTPGEGPASIGAPGARTVLERVHYADSHWMHPVLHLVDDDDWSGDAAEKFCTDFLLPFRRAAEQQRACTAILTVAAQAFHGSVIKARHDILKIAEDCATVLRGDGLSEADSAFFNVIESALGLVPGIGTILDLVDVGASVVSVFVGGNGEASEPVPIVVDQGYDPPVTILHSAWDRLAELDARVADQDAVMADGLNADASSAQAFASSHLVLPRPAAADSTDPFSELKIADRPGVALPERPVVVSIVQLYQAGYVNLPSAAHQYGEAVDQLDRAEMPDWVRRFIPGAVAAFEEARQQLRSALSDTASSLTDIGTNLVDAATTYQLSDEQSGEVMRQIGLIAPPRLDQPELIGTPGLQAV